MAGSIDLPTLVQKYRLDSEGFNQGASQVEARSKSMAATSSTAIKQGTTKSGAAFAALDTQLGSFGKPLKGAVSDIGSELDKTEGQTKKTATGFSGLSAGMAVTAAAGFGLFKVFKTGFDETKDASAGQAQLTAGIKSTGNAANVSVDQLEKLATTIQGYSGQTDDSIVASEQLLLTFTNIKNEVGAGNDVFNQAVTATADLAAKMGGDASTNAIRLGKALNDPVKGLTALTKVGVSFSEEQKKQVQAFVDSGNIMGAQKIILGELTKEFGGAAKAAGESLPGSLARAQRSFEDMSQSIVQGAAPALASIAGGVVAGITGFQGFNRELEGIPGKAVAVGTGLTVAIVAGSKAKSVFEDAAKALGLMSKSSELSALELLSVVGPAALVVGGITGLGLTLNHFFGGDNHAAEIKGLAANLQLVGDKATDAQKSLNSIIGTASTVLLSQYSDQLLAGASAADLAKTKNQLMGQAILDNGGNFLKARDQVNTATKALDDNTKAQGASGVQTQALSAAQKQYADDLAKGHVADTVLAKDKAAVIAASAAQAKTQSAVNDATAAGTDASEKSAATIKAEDKARKDLVTSLDKYGEVAGKTAEKVVDGLGLSRDAVDKLTDSTKAMNDGIDKAFNTAGSVIDAWSTKSHFDLQKFEQDLLTQTVATAQWSQNIATLSKAGIDKGFLQTLIDAGPKAAVEVKGLVDGVKVGSVQAINSIVATGKTAAGQAKSTVDAGLLGIRASFADFIAFVNNAHPNLDVRIAGQSATPDQIHSLALAQRGHVGLTFGDGGPVPGPKGSPVAATVHGGEFVLSNAMLDAAARGTANGFTAASGTSSSTATPEMVHREYHVHGPYAVKAELSTYDIEATFRRMELLEPPG